MRRAFVQMLDHALPHHAVISRRRRHARLLGPGTASPAPYLDTRTIGPAESFRVRWREDAPGTWLYHCHVESHMANGMVGIYRVSR